MKTLIKNGLVVAAVDDYRAELIRVKIWSCRQRGTQASDDFLTWSGHDSTCRGVIKYMVWL